MTNATSESGAELLARLGGRPSLEGLEPELFENGPPPTGIFEFYGNEGTGKSQMLLHLIARCLLPKLGFNLSLGGFDSGVVFIDTDYKFPLLRLVTIMEKKIELCIQNTAAKTPDEHEIEDFILNCLNKLTIFHCSSSAQLLATLHTLESTLCNRPEVSLLIIDSISAFYWVDKSNGGDSLHLQEANMRFISQIIKKLVNVYKLVGILTKCALLKPQVKDRGDNSNLFSSEVSYRSGKDEVTEAVEFLCKQYQKIVTKQFVFSRSDSCFKVASQFGFCKSFTILDSGVKFM